MNPLYLHGEGYQPEEEVQVNTILGTVFPQASESEKTEIVKYNTQMINHKYSYIFTYRDLNLDS